MSDRTTDIINSNATQHKILSNVSYSLASLSSAFDRTGNYDLATDLFELSEEIRAASDELRGNASEMISLQFNEEKQSTLNIISTLAASYGISKD